MKGSSAKRILAWLPGLTEHGGIARHNRALCRAVKDYAAERAAEFDVVTLRDPPGWFDERLLDRPLVGCEGDRHRFAIRTVASLAPGFDLLIVGVVDFGPLVPMARLRSPAGRILTFTHGIEVWKPLPRTYAWALRWAHQVIAVSDFTAEEVAQRHGVDRSAITVVRPSLVELAPAERSGGINGRSSDDQSGAQLLTVARMNRIDAPKGVDQVIAALPHIAACAGPVRYVVVGDGDDRPRLESLARSMGVADTVRFVGRVDDEQLRGYLADSDLFVLPSAKEGFGIVFLEAMANGLPVVAGAHGGSPEAVSDGETGVLVRPGDRGELVSAVTGLLADRDRREAMGRAGQARVSAMHSYEGFRDATFNVLNDLLERRDVADSH